MREIKFRGLSETGWKTIDLTGSMAWAKELLSLISRDESSFRFKTPLEQFTGLRDKNGREIYEGDILRRPGFESVWKVESNTGCFLKKSIANGYSSHLHEDDNMEIIGNIHENPELLK